MKLKIFTLRMNPATGQFDDEELAASMRSRISHAEHVDTLALRRSLAI